MKRIFNGRELELLAPAGTFDILRALTDSGCDAIYTGGSILNMRMIRKGYNLTNEELREAVALSHEKGKKLYITLNNLLDSSEIPEALEFLEFLHEIRPDALIVQDTALLRLMKGWNDALPLHASVMMNVHNLDMIRLLETYGVERVVLSREMPLREAREISKQTEVELEYFIHGDMCVTHGAQCLYSSYLFGMSSSRGRCLKPCRWPFTLTGGTAEASSLPFPLAVKDMNMYHHLRELILSGISSFKIEGRMREKEFITALTDTYAAQLDRFLDSPLSTAGGGETGPVQMEEDPLGRFRKRDYSTGYAFGTPGLKNINTRGEGTGTFYSTGKMFSEPTEELETDAVPSSYALSRILGSQRRLKSTPVHRTFLSARVNDIGHGRSLLASSLDRIYLSGEPYAPSDLPRREELARFAGECRKAGIELFLTLPRMMDSAQSDLFRGWYERGGFDGLDGIMVSQSGALRWLRDVSGDRTYVLAGDASLNIYNAEAAAFYREEGLSFWTPSLELPLENLLDLGRASVPSEMEIVLHGLPAVMYMDHDVSGKKSPLSTLKTEAGELQVRRDRWDRYHLLPSREQTLIPLLPSLFEAGYRNFRLELQAYSSEESLAVIASARQALQHPQRAQDILSEMKSVTGGFTYGAHTF